MAKRNRNQAAEEATTTEVADPKAEKKSKNQAKRANKKAALLTVLGVVKNSEDYAENETVVAAVKLLTPGARFGGTRTGVTDVIAEAFMENPTIDEDQIWGEYKLGRKEMRSICVNLIKKREADDRLWISFDAEAGLYTLETTGAEAPADWSGYTPVDMVDMEI